MVKAVIITDRTGSELEEFKAKIQEQLPGTVIKITPSTKAGTPFHQEEIDFKSLCKEHEPHLIIIDGELGAHLPQSLFKFNRDRLLAIGTQILKKNADDGYHDGKSLEKLKEFHSFFFKEAKEILKEKKPEEIHEILSGISLGHVLSLIDVVADPELSMKDIPYFYIETEDKASYRISQYLQAQDFSGTACFDMKEKKSI